MRPGVPQEREKEETGRVARWTGAQERKEGRTDPPLRPLLRLPSAPTHTATTVTLSHY